MFNQITGTLRALVPMLVTYFVARGYLPTELQGVAGELLLAAVGFSAAAWSWWSNRPAAQVAAVAALPGTTVSPTGKTILVLDPQLAEAAKSAATDASGK